MGRQRSHKGDMYGDSANTTWIDVFYDIPDFFIYGALIIVAYAFLMGRSIASRRCPGCGKRKFIVEFPFNISWNDPKDCLVEKNRKKRETAST